MAESTNYTPFEQSERSRNFDTFISATQYAIRDLAKANTYPRQDLEGFHERVAGYFLPNISHGVVDIPREYMRTDRTPLLVEDGSETLFLGKSFIDQVSTQSMAAVAQYHEHGFYGIDRYLHTSLIARSRQHRANQPEQLPAFAPTTAARADSRIWGLTDREGAEVALLGRPIIRIRNSIAYVAMASLIRHEDEHVIERHHEPFYTTQYGGEDASIRRELRAYHAQWLFNKALVAADPEFYKNIEARTEVATRAKLVNLNSPNDPYAASKAVKRAIARRKLIL